MSTPALSILVLIVYEAPFVLSSIFLGQRPQSAQPHRVQTRNARNTNLEPANGCRRIALIHIMISADPFALC